MSFPTEKEAREFLRNYDYLSERFKPAATKVHVIDGIIFFFMLERGLPFVIASGIPLLSPRLKLDQATALVNAVNTYYDKCDIERFCAAARPLDIDVPNALRRICYSEEYGHEVEQVAHACYDAMEREAVGGSGWTRDELVAALTVEVDEYWEIEAQRQRAAIPAGFSRNFKFELQAIFDDEDRAFEEERQQREAEQKRQAAELQSQQMEMQWQQDQQRMLMLQDQDPQQQGGQQQQ